ncbi:MAG: hypothetical protein CVV02_11335 [Firmicutes bacterium HGW-Firmicutes-7]|nr:MAG: hypothetical protein CVV02_11335 [Firmicutes bacterium HGW-Firmicutes-7]
MFIKKISFVIVCLISLVLTLPSFAYAKQSEKDKKDEIPIVMEPGAVITYDENNDPVISIYLEPNESNILGDSNSLNSTQKDIVDKEGRKAEDDFCNAIRTEAAKLPQVKLGWDLPEPQPGMVVIYGSDGRINHIYSQEMVSVKASVPSTTVKYPGRLSAGEYTFGTNQKVTITSNTVLGEGRFTVFRAGVGGSGTVGSSGKTLCTSDIATKRQIDNPKHNTAITARAIDTDVVKTVYKNDIGSLPDAVMDVYFWDWTNEYFGYMYSDTLSFSGRYYYTF